MNPHRIREAIGVVAERLRKNEAVDLTAAVVGSDVEAWLEDLAVATIAKDAARVKRGIREGGRKGWAQAQLELPGLEHAALPVVAWRRDADGNEIGVAMPLATVGEMKREVGLNRRAVTVQDKVVAGWEATLDKIEELGFGDDVVIGEIIAQFAQQREISSDA